MSPTPGHNRKDSWRNSSGGGSWNRGATQRSWRSPDTKPPSEEGFFARLRERGFFRFFTSACAAVLCIAAIIWILQLPGCTNTDLWLVTYTPDIRGIAPPKAFFLNQREAVEKLREQPRYSGRTVSWEEAGTRLKETDRDKVLVLYVAGHAVEVPADDGSRRTEILLLPDNADPDNRADYRPLRDLWSALRNNCDPRQKKLVLLDLFDLHDQWRLGLFHSAMRSDLESAIEGIRNLVVVTGCSPLQRSWAADNLDGGQSVFGHFALAGLQGDADRTGDGQIQLGELVEFLTTRTDQWVRRNRDRNGQQPLRFSTVDDASANEWVIVSRARGGEEAGTGSDAAPPAATEERIEQAWNRRGELAERYPTGPYQYAPLQWRALTDRLIDAETWADAGDPAAAAEIIGDAENRIDRLEAAIKTGRFENDAFRNNAPFVYDNTVRRLQYGWGAGGGDPVGGGGAAERFRGETTGPLKLPETHLQEELFAHLPPGNTTAQNLSGEFFNLRRQAEFAAGWSLETLEAVRSLLTTADRERRFGEDYLFVGDTENARAHLTAARQQYDTIIEIRRILNRASSVRNTTFADLYYLADWSAHRYPHPGSDFRADVMRIYQADRDFRPGSGELDSSRQAPASDDITRFNRDCNTIEIAVLRLLETARQLDEQLSEIKTVENVRDEDLLHLDALAKKAAEGHKTIRDGLQRLASEAIARDPDQPNLEYWRPLRDLLRLPFFDGETRRGLRDKAADFSRTMQRNTADEAPPAATQTPEEAEAFAGSEWSAFWAIQALSPGPEDWATLQSRGTGYTLNDLQQQWKDLRAAEPDDKSWRLVRLGDAVRRAWRAKRDKVDSILKGWPDENASVDPAEIPVHRRQLSEADRLARTLHPWDARRLDDAAADPALKYNRFLMADLLHTHAGRYLEDFYAGWYAPAADACLNAVDASMTSVFKVKGRELKNTKKQLQKLENNWITLARSDPSPIQFDSSGKGTVRPAVEAIAHLPAGHAAFWLDLQSLTADVAASPSHRRAIDTTRQGAVDLPPIELTWTPQPQLAGKTQTVSLRTFFRGHLWQTPVPLHLRLPGTTTVKYTPPQGPATVVLRGVDRRPIMFVLDGSGSMVSKTDRVTITENGERKDVSKFEAAKSTLVTALRGIRNLDQNDPELRKNPTKVGLILFLRDALQNRGMVSDEVRLLAKVRPLDSSHLSEIESQLQAFPDSRIGRGRTPLMKSLDLAISKLDNPSGAIVALTDGAFTDDNDTVESFKDNLKGLRDQGNEIEIHIVAFKVSDPTETEKLRTLTDRDINAKFHSAESVDVLLRELDSATRKRPYKVFCSRLPDWEIEQVLNRTAELKPGENFRIHFGALKPVPFDIRGGEALEFELDPQTREIRHSKPDLRPNVVVAQAPNRQDPRTYSLGYRTYELTRGKQARFELLLVHDDNKAAVPHPEEITFVIRPENDSSERSYAWKPLAGVSVPGWEVTIDDWPVEKRPRATIQVYWKLQRTPPDQEIPLNNLRNGQPKKIPLPASNGAQLPFLLAASWTPDSVEVDLQVADGGGAPDVLPEDLARMKIQFARRDPGSDNWSPADLPFTSDHITEEGRRTVTFEQIPPGFAAQDWAVLVTSWKSLGEGCHQLQRELVAGKPTNFQ